MPRTRRVSRKQRGGFLDFLSGLFGEKKSNNSTTGQDSLAAPVSPNTTYTTNAAVGGKRRKSQKSKAQRKAHRKAKTHRKANRKTRRH